MEEIKSGSLLSVQSEQREDIQFGTVGEILTVSSSVQSDSPPHGEVTSVKVGASNEEVSCEDFKVVKGKNAYSKFKRNVN